MPRLPALSLSKFSRRSLLFIVAAGALFFLTLRRHSVSYSDQIARWAPSLGIADAINDPGHPIDNLVAKADRTFSSLLDQQASGVSAAAQAYRTRRGRHPPPEFDKWVEYAEQNQALIVEEFFDGIYDDLEPFWSVGGKEIRERASSWPNIISVRDHVVKINRSPGSAKGKLKWRFEMFKLLQDRLPDVDLAISIEDQQPIVVPWEDIESALKKTRQSRAEPLLSPASIPFSAFANLPELPYPTDEDKKKWKTMWSGETSYWDMCRKACPPRSPARSSGQESDFKRPPTFSNGLPWKSYKGYVGNWTEAKSPCVHPELRNLHGSFVGPHIHGRHSLLFPLFAESKIQDMNNVIVLPAGHSWNIEKKQSWLTQTPEPAWDTKYDKMVWRGPAVGGHHNKNNWKRFHRHRFVAMTNSSWVSAVEATAGDLDIKSEPPVVFPLPSNDTWSLSAMATKPSQLGTWVGNLVDVGFVHFMCNPATGLAGLSKPAHCDYVTPYYKIKKDIDMPELSDWKYVADIDGDGSSPRFSKLLRSGSVPLKATIFSEWHDKRLVPWKHFIPVDNTFADLWGILEYFLGYDEGDETDRKEGHDVVAKAIAEQGQAWSKRALRREDMLLYVYRLVLEYARLCDDRRDNMGYVKDLIP